MHQPELSGGQHPVPNCVGLGIRDKVGFDYKRRFLNEGLEQHGAAADEDGRIGAEIHLKLPELIQDAPCMALGLRKYGRPDIIR